MNERYFELASSFILAREEQGNKWLPMIGIREKREREGETVPHEHIFADEQMDIHDCLGTSKWMRQLVRAAIVLHKTNIYKNL
jgi:hypothetical protein